jgi:exonuclease III
LRNFASALDNEGRCLLTLISNLAVFNVYTPNDGAFSVNLPLKLQFLRALRSSMTRMRALGFAVVLCGTYIYIHMYV